jgi:hypothetical protein
LSGVCEPAEEAVDDDVSDELVDDGGADDCGAIDELLLAVFAGGCDIEVLSGLPWLQAASEVATAIETTATADCVMAFMLHSPIGCDGNTLPTALVAADASSLRA